MGRFYSTEQRWPGVGNIAFSLPGASAEFLVSPQQEPRTLLLLLDTSLTFVLGYWALSARPVLSCYAPPGTLWAKSLPRWPHPGSLGGSTLWKQPLPSRLRLQWRYHPQDPTLPHQAGGWATCLKAFSGTGQHPPALHPDTKDKFSSGPLKPSLRLEVKGQDCSFMGQGNSPAVPLLSPRNHLSLSLQPGCGVLG